MEPDGVELDVSRRVYERLVAAAQVPAPRVRAWEGTTWGPVDAASTIVLRHPGALRAVAFPPSDLTAGEAYVYDDIDIEGDIFEVLRFGAAVTQRPPGRLAALRTMRDLRKLPADHRRNAALRPGFSGRLHSKRRDADAVSYHYDTGNDFYRLFLGETMAYSCAYFLDPAEELDAAQRRKLDVVCRKLELTSGMTLLDIGCGWGSLVVHAAAKYGVSGTGVTVSAEQAEHARRLAKERGVDDRVSIIHGDYREVRGQFDAIASIGMVEHVGANRLPEYFGHARRLLAGGGQFLNHGITTRDRHPGRRRPTFVSTYVFPDGELETVDVMAGAAADQGLEVRDVEALRMSYARTLRHWVANLEADRDRAVAMTDERTYRTWRAYMAGSALAFESAGIGIHQFLLADPERPWRYGRRRLLAADDV